MSPIRCTRIANAIKSSWYEDFFADRAQPCQWLDFSWPFRNWLNLPVIAQHFVIYLRGAYCEPRTFTPIVICFHWKLPFRFWLSSLHSVPGRTINKEKRNASKVRVRQQGSVIGSAVWSSVIIICALNSTFVEEDQSTQAMISRV